MKKIACLIIAVVISAAAAVPASSQIRFGLKAGVAVNKLKFDSDAAHMFDAENRAGFTGGAMLEFTVPVLGVGMDASVMYVHRTGEAVIDNEKTDYARDYIDIPLNVKWKISIPVVSKIIKPYLATGPDFAFRVSKNDFKEFVKQRRCDISWNFGFGVELLSHLQVGASYGIGLTKTMQVLKVQDNAANIEGKNKYWTITAAYLF